MARDSVISTQSSRKPTTYPQFDSLHMPVQFVQGVGPHRAQILSKVNISTPKDLLLYFPRDHQDRRANFIRNCILGKKIAIQARVEVVQFRQIGKALGQARAIVKDETGVIDAIWFKHITYKYDVFSGLKKLLQQGAHLLIYGQVVKTKQGIGIRVEFCEPVSQPGEHSIHTNKIVPIYSLTEGLQEKWLREVAFRIVHRYGEQVKDPLPEPIRSSLNLPIFSKAVKNYHFPQNWIERDQARERLAFDEFFFLELALELSRQNRRKETKGFQSYPTRKILTPFKKHLDYEFTQAQTRTINEIFRDMARPSPMNRLLQGDVGSGKTVVALSAALLAIENSKQVALLAPTEILAEQHALTMGHFFQDLPVKWALLTRSTPASERKKILQQLQSGRLDLLVGTHAILNEKVLFHQMGLVIIDEQHRFGVRQRARLLSKSKDEGVENALSAKPDVLIMTATPIPRTLALTLYGDLDVSVIDELPKGRAAIKTIQVTETEAMNQIFETVEQGQQVYVVLPLIEESEALSKKNGKEIRTAKKEFEKLQTRFQSYSIGLLHGQLPADQKRKIMHQFREGKISILVSTTVIEVGIDVPNSTLLVIQNPERFGLAQLHQLRGRVGRGRLPSKCLLIVDSIEELSQARLDIFCSFLDGFRLAEEDLKLRGPGEILGEAQHGVPFFKVGNLIKDRLLISQAREMARRLVEGEMPMT
ncbi:hypothetical protein BVX98_05385, partial [bacterium F11]